MSFTGLDYLIGGVIGSRSDINEHILTFVNYSRTCQTVLECGTRSVVSTWGFFKGLVDSNQQNKKLYGCDLNYSQNIDHVKKMCKAYDIEYQFLQGNDLDIEIEPIDIIFIDTWHVYGHLKRELKKFAPLCKKYIMMHDTVVDAERGETIRCGWNAEKQSEETGIPVHEINLGLRPAIEEFLQDNKDFVLEKHFTNNNGLTILKRVKPIAKKFNKIRLNEYKFDVNEVINTDKYYNIANLNNIPYHKTDIFYNNYPIIFKGKLDVLNSSSKTIIVGHSDYDFGDQCLAKTDRQNIEKIFCINRATESSKVISLPLGVTNYDESNFIFKLYGDNSMIEKVVNERNGKKYLCYMNFNLNTHIDRKKVYPMFENQSYVKIGKPENTYEGRFNFLREISQSKFVICPRGGGVDTHRIWESLYLGSIPIVKYEKSYHDNFLDLPILFIEDWDQITEEFLNEKYEQMINSEWNMSKLNISYWEQEISLNK
jgi:hypothetical protein